MEKQIKKGIIMIPSQIKITRLETNDICTTGAIFINGRFIAISLEPPKFGNTSDFSCIPCDTYNYFKRYSNKHKYEVIELSNVYKRSYIQMHIGNKPSETSGCILPGLLFYTWKHYDEEKPFFYSPAVLKSKDALDLILSLSTSTGIVTITEHF